MLPANFSFWVWPDWSSFRYRVRRLAGFLYYRHTCQKIYTKPFIRFDAAGVIIKKWYESPTSMERTLKCSVERYLLTSISKTTVCCKSLQKMGSCWTGWIHHFCRATCRRHRWEGGPCHELKTHQARPSVRSTVQIILKCINWAKFPNFADIPGLSFAWDRARQLIHYNEFTTKPFYTLFRRIGQYIWRYQPVHYGPERMGCPAGSKWWVDRITEWRKSIRTPGPERHWNRCEDRGDALVWKGLGRCSLYSPAHTDYIWCLWNGQRCTTLPLFCYTALVGWMINFMFRLSG